MSQVQVGRFWCLFEEDAFAVDAHLEWDVSQFTEAIMAKKNCLRGCDTSDIVLLKLNNPIPVDPEETLLQRLPKPITNFSVKLGLTAQVEDVLPRRPKDLQIIVTLRGTAPSSFKRRRLDNLDLSKWEFLWHTFWGNPVPECFVKGSAYIPDQRTLEKPTEETNYEYLRLPNNDNSFPCDLRRILITETYTSLYTLLCEQDKLYAELTEERRLRSYKHSTLITGQPGTGKTVGLSCILVWRLQEKKPTIYCSDKMHAYVFTSTGLDRVDLGGRNRIEALDNSVDCCALVDINPDLLEVPSEFRPSLARQGRVVVATSPNPNHVTIFKQEHARTYYTPTWKWADLYCASLVQFRHVDAETLRNAYTKLSGIPRRCFDVLSEGDAREIETIKFAIDNIDNIDDFAKSASGPLPFKTKTSHALVRMEPTDENWGDQITNLLSDYVADLVFDRIDLHNTLKIRDSIDSLLHNPNARSWGGKLFERAVHRAFRKGFEFEAVAMDDDAPSLFVRINKAKSEASGYFHTLTVRDGKGSRNVAKEFVNQYLIPLSSTAETIDGVDILKDVTVLFQMTVAPTNSLNLKGITELTDELPASAKKRICIVFVVPDHHTTRKPYKRQNIVIPLAVSESVSDPVVAYKQYVYYFPMDKL